MPQKPFDVAIADMAHSIGQLIRRMRAAAAEHELSLTESAVLARLSKDGPATTAELARAESMKPQSMATTIAALEEIGLVERNKHPTEGRKVNIELTGKGGRRPKPVKDAKRTWLAQAILQLDEQD